MRPLAEAIGWAVLAGAVVYAAAGGYTIARLAIACAGDCSW